MVIDGLVEIDVEASSCFNLQAFGSGSTLSLERDEMNMFTFSVGLTIVQEC